MVVDLLTRLEHASAAKINLMTRNARNLEWNWSFSLNRNKFKRDPFLEYGLLCGTRLTAHAMYSMLLDHRLDRKMFLLVNQNNRFIKIDHSFNILLLNEAMR